MHPMVQQILAQLQQAMAQGALPPEALLQLLQGLEGMMQGAPGAGAPPPPMQMGGGMPSMGGPQQADMMQMLR